MKTILVTGGAGFIGSAVVRHLIGRTEHRVVNVDCLTYAGNPDSLAEAADSPRYAFERVDIRHGPALRRAFETHRPGAVLHLAAESHVDRSLDGPREFLHTNVLGTFTLLTESRRHFEGLDAEERERFRFVHVSTDEVYGSLGPTGLFTEASPYAPSSPYAASKASADHLARVWHHVYRLPVIVTNCSNNYGPYQFPEKLIPHMVLRAVERRRLPVYGDGRNVRDWLYVDDHVEALLAALGRGRPGETYNIGGGCERQNIQLVRAICALLDEIRPRGDGRSYAQQIAFVADRRAHDRRYAIDAGKIERELGWRPRESFETGLEKTVRWYLENEWWWRRIRERGYRGERLGLLA